MYRRLSCCPAWPQTTGCSDSSAAASAEPGHSHLDRAGWPGVPRRLRRAARTVHRPRQACFIGGASFGGMVALEMAVHLRTEACFLVASVAFGSRTPLAVPALRPLARLGPQRFGTVAAWVARWPTRLLPEGVVGRLRRLSDPRSAFLRWASWAVLNWRPAPRSGGVRIYQIHGAADRTLPLRYTRPDVVVAGAGHLLPLTHPDAVNEFIRRRVEKWCLA